MVKMWFFTKKQPKNVEFTPIERLQRLETRVSLLEANTLDLATGQEIIRNKVLRKIQFKQEKEEPAKDLYAGMFLSEK
jgi:hypothetical protein